MGVESLAGASLFAELPERLDGPPDEECQPACKSEPKPIFWRSFLDDVPSFLEGQKRSPECQGKEADFEYKV